MRSTTTSAVFIACVMAACAADDDDVCETGSPASHHQYIIDKLVMPNNSTEARQDGLDLDHDNVVDNQLGMVFGTVEGQLLIDFQRAADAAIDRGTILSLIDLETPDPVSSCGANVAIYHASNPVPSPCAPDDTSCRRHLDGSGTFDVDSQDDIRFAGSVDDSTFTGGSGEFSLQLALDPSAPPIAIPLIGARVRLSGLTGETAAGVIAGALTQDAVDSVLVPAFQRLFVHEIERDCFGTDPTTTPPCLCVTGSPGQTLIQAFDTNPRDCWVSADEIKRSEFVQSLTAPDVTIDGVEALSVGVGFTAVRAVANEKL